VVFRASSLSGPDKAALPDQTIEHGERFRAIESGRGADVAGC